jgi:hypothetical protein
MAAAFQPTVLVLGHSFVRRLSDFVHERRESCVPNFDLPCNVKFIGTGGLRVYNLWAYLDDVSRILPDIVVLDVGTNDLSSDNSCPGELADSVHRFAEHLINNFGVKTVNIAQIFRRLPGAERTPVDFNSKVFAYNAALQSLCLRSQAVSPSSPIAMFFFRGMSQCWEQYLNPVDGVHFSVIPLQSATHSGSYRYYRAIKTSIIYALRTPSVVAAFPY